MDTAPANEPAGNPLTAASLPQGATDDSRLWVLQAQIGWIEGAAQSKAAADDPAGYAGVPAPFERTSCFACVAPEDRVWWRFLVPEDWVPPLLVEVPLPSGLLLLAHPPLGHAGTSLRCSIPKSEASARDLGFCPLCCRINCQCSFKTQLAKEISQLGQQLSFSRRSAVRRVRLHDSGAWLQAEGKKEAKKVLTDEGWPVPRRERSFSRRTLSFSSRKSSNGSRLTAAEELGQSAGAAEAVPTGTSAFTAAPTFPLAAALATRWQRVASHLGSMAGARLKVTPLPAGELDVQFEHGVRPPVVHSTGEASPLHNIISPGAVVALVGLSGESEDCAAMDGDDIGAALRAHVGSGRRTLHWIAAEDIPEVLASIAEKEASLVRAKMVASWDLRLGAKYPTRLVLPCGKKATPQDIKAAAAEYSRSGLTPSGWALAGVSEIARDQKHEG